MNENVEFRYSEGGGFNPSEVIEALMMVLDVLPDTRYRTNPFV